MNIYQNPTPDQWDQLIARPQVDGVELEATVSQVFEAVNEFGDKAIRKYTNQFDHVNLDDFRVTEDEMSAADLLVSSELQSAIRMAAKNIRTFHAVQIQKEEVVETVKGVECWQTQRGIEKVGIYIPGGTAPLFSTVLMLAIPAVLAGCKEVVLCTPPDEEGKVNPAILFAAKLTGVTTVLKVGGIQAIAGLTFGTESISQVYKIFGPGNQYVTAAKQYAQRLGVAIDMPAGPSELLVMADRSADVSFVAADLLSQAEHGADSQVIAVLSQESLVAPLLEEVEQQLAVLPRRALAKQALENSKIIVFPNREDRIDFTNRYAPEHLIISEENPESILAEITSAGSVFLGNYTPESAGDYASGTNHTLPTSGFARAYSGVNMDAFVKKITVQKISREGIQNLGTAVEQMATAEMLQAHKNAVSIRLKSLAS